jgi:cellulose synthase/poly-beta-1,6-N-acetylglucosamine synthase-like glycosyltransferase
LCIFVETLPIKMDLTIIIAYYKAIDNLKLILKALNHQSNANFEVILSEDDFNQETISFLSDNKDLYNFPINHLYQQGDIGFRKNMMLNRSILQAKSDTVVFIDGDCIPHKHFVKEYIKNSNYNSILSGRRVMMSKKISSDLLNNSTLQKLNFLSFIFSASKKIKESIYFPYFQLSTKTRGLLGCNWGVKKQHLLDVNGFDEDYIRAGVGEDNDIEWRLEANGLKKKSMKNKAIVYHMYHPKGYSEEGVLKNFKLLETKKEVNHIRCLNGIKTIGNIK